MDLLIQCLQGFLTKNGIVNLERVQMIMISELKVWIAQAVGPLSLLETFLCVLLVQKCWHSFVVICSECMFQH